MRKVTGTFATVCALMTALLVAGCVAGVRSVGKDTKSSEEVFLQPVAAQGPDPFTPSTAVSTATPSPATRTPRTDPSTSTEPAQAVRSIPGSTPGLYGGTERIGSCDVDRQIAYLTSDPAKARAFAEVVGVSPASVTGYLRGLAPVVLRADTRVTNHGFRGGRATSFEAVLQAGTAVLVDNRGVPRVRCACGNPLKPATATESGRHLNGRPWFGYRPAQVIVVTPAPQVITNITIINIVDNTWIERPIGHGVHHDHTVSPPTSTTRPPSPDHSGASTGPSTSTGSPSPSASTGTPSPSASTGSPSPSAQSSSPSDLSPSPSGSATGCATPTPTPGATGDVTTGKPSAGPTGCLSTTATAAPPASKPGSSTPGAATTATRVPETSPGPTDEIGPGTVTDTPGLPDGGGLVPGGTTSRSILDSPTGVFGS
ncbi:hypothetical protein GCM10022403_047100 [Streptomyces coacervatus]|uniref:DUF6777 domain-containing protein n=1 Tax=Streptomyces coacervatus TaxID=647381 RepID=A0ABP7HZM0_9ACTN|nr:DUF6777 domain-containing protein [Streptomyces coacervatus]MDF2266427.1 hypothetical protein [Streptomyces coacervatus]